ncbi:MAG TPA: FtsX-like permease family protein [Steroidobacteraceae bacterium]|jgi:putative ABC transport system permease protein|nr:FtsX-like permease family protein [Steroidobacteraceae bacterium]
MRLAWAAVLRHLLRHPAQLALALVGLALGVATIAAVDMATASAARAFELSIDAVNGTATHEIVAGPAGIDERLYVALRRAAGPIEFAPVVEGYAEIGARTLQLVGIDPLASPAFAAAVEGGAAMSVQRADLARWFSDAGTVMMASDTARALHLSAGESFDLEVSGRTRAATLLTAFGGERPGDDALLLTDIAQAQEWLDLVGRLSRIELRVSADRAAELALQRLKERLPAGLEVRAAGSRTHENLELSAAFTTNLQAMSLLALLVGFFLIYSAVSFAVVQRRALIGVLRALGATRAQMLTALLAEAALIGAVGAVTGLLLGALIGHALVRLVAGTINDLYFVVAVTGVRLPASSVVKALGAGLGVALLAAALPAIEAANSQPQLGLKRSVLEERAAGAARALLLASALLALGALAIAYGSARSLFAGFVALFCLLLAVAALAPAVLRAGARAAARLLARASPIARLALNDVAASLSRTGVAVAALSLAVCAMIGVALMVDSFRESLHDWLARTLRADFYVSAPGPGFARPERRIEKAVAAALLATPGIRAHSESRRVRVESQDFGPLSLDALQLAPESFAGFQLTAGDPATVWRAYEHGSLVISEPLAWRLRLAVGARLTLMTARGFHAFTIAGIYREYGNDRGTVLMQRATYAAWWQDDALTALGLYLAPLARPADVRAALYAASAGRQALLIRSNAEVRALSMAIFERTFVITRVLCWLTAGVAALSLVSALVAWQLERARELALLRALGLTPRGVAFLIAAQTGCIGAAALLTALPAGVLTALMLIDVVNRRAFGWQIDLHVHPAAFGAAATVALVAAFAAGLYPAWKSARAPLAQAIREE